MIKKFLIYIENLSSNTTDAFNLNQKSLFGERKYGKIVYTPYEILYLIETKKAEALKNNKKLSEEKLISLFSRKFKNFIINYSAFKDMRKKGYIIKPGLKFGSEFRVYKTKKDKHASWILFPVKQSTKITWEDFVAKSRVCNSTGKKLLIAIVDQQESVVYYETNWFKA